MPTRRRPSRPIAHRASYARTSGTSLVYNDPDGWVTDGLHGPLWWMGSDSATGPVGPWGPNPVRLLPAVARLTSLITDPLSVAPWKVVEDGFGGETLPTPRWLDDPQLTRPDDRFPSQALPAVQRHPRTAFWASWLRIAVLFGQAGIAYLEDATGAPMAGSMRVLHPQHLTSTRNSEGVLVWQLGDDQDYVQADRDGRFTIGSMSWRIIVLRDPHGATDIEGRTSSVFERHPTTFGLTSQIDGFMGGVFRSGIPSGVLSVNSPTPMTQDQASALKASWMAAHSGSAKSVAVLASTVDFTPLSVTPIDASLIESKRANLGDLCMCFCLDAQGALGISMGGSQTYSNIAQWFARLKTDLMPWIETIEQVLSALLPAGRSVRMDFSEYTRPDPKEQYEALRVAVDSEILTVDEARNILGLPPKPTPPPAPAPVVVEAAPVEEPVPPESEPAAVRSIRRQQAWR